MVEGAQTASTSHGETDTCCFKHDIRPKMTQHVRRTHTSLRLSRNSISSIVVRRSVTPPRCSSSTHLRTVCRCCSCEGSVFTPFQTWPTNSPSDRMRDLREWLPMASTGDHSCGRAVCSITCKRTAAGLGGHFDTGRFHGAWRPRAINPLSLGPPSVRWQSG